MRYAGQIPSLLELLESEKLDDRLTAIQILGEIGDEKALEALRQRLKPVNYSRLQSASRSLARGFIPWRLAPASSPGFVPRLRPLASGLTSSAERVSERSIYTRLYPQ